MLLLTAGPLLEVLRLPQRRLEQPRSTVSSLHRRNYKTLHANLAHYGVEDKAETKNIGLGEEPGELQLNLSKSGCDDSFLEPDEGDLGQSETVEIKTLSDFYPRRRHRS